ncbi:GH1 family beta-glucosidase [Mucilaginibacter sp. UR6-11]|uniref:GH1 family beta-glucosidase n=1 Tax=Mucilaginibacter sp. UR6-11 TaxID=1435644 RepID=UPI001E2AB898|nr:GH1 family beta-glucosidase [Mucilaginibacter sp. UR6-11]MCC8426157.1 beta-glucosidase [Mucilaginibacter sp. UR6-11]
MKSNIQDTPLNKQLFGEDFIWGISTAAVQIEGAHDADGKGESIWDVFTQKKGKILNGHHHHIATDFYNRYQSDIDLIKQLNIPNFRFSISWSRILPDGTGEVNQAGIDYYNRVINYCIELGIEPWLTLYHWDLPHALEQQGGWTNRAIVDWFTEYVAVCANAFGDRVKHWMVMNEPSVFTGAGYFLGIHAPGRKGIKNFLPAIHHAVLCIAAGARTLRGILPDSEIGTTFSCSYIEPYSAKPRDVAAAIRVDALLNRLFIEPILGLGYPAELTVLAGMDKYILPGDMDSVKFDFDFIGLQNYTREIVEHSFFTPYIHASLVKAEKRKVPITAMGWEVYPASIYHILKKYDLYPQIRKVYLTESGAAFKDEVVDDLVDDPKRVEYLQQYLQQVLKAKNEGCKVEGYFIWTLTDNFEWAEGYHPRFGIIYVDFETQQRIIKSSGLWYAGLLR